METRCSLPRRRRSKTKTSGALRWERSPHTRKRMTQLGARIPDSAERTPNALQELVQSEVARWASILKPIDQRPSSPYRTRTVGWTNGAIAISPKVETGLKTDKHEAWHLSAESAEGFDCYVARYIAPCRCRYRNVGFPAFHSGGGINYQCHKLVHTFRRPLFAGQNRSERRRIRQGCPR
jgi:hypothetical protein